MKKEILEAIETAMETIKERKENWEAGTKARAALFLAYKALEDAKKEIQSGIE